MVPTLDEEDKELHGEDFLFFNGDGSKALLMIESSELFCVMSSETSLCVADFSASNTPSKNSCQEKELKSERKL